MTSNVWTIDVVDLGEWILAGVDDWLAGDPRLNEVLDPTSTKPMVLLAHTPTTVDALRRCTSERTAVQLVLSGHTRWTDPCQGLDLLGYRPVPEPYVGGYEAGEISFSFQGVLGGPSYRSVLVPA